MSTTSQQAHTTSQQAHTTTDNAGRSSPIPSEAHQQAGGRKAKAVLVENIIQKSVKRGGVVYQGKPDPARSYNAEIVKNSSIRLFGVLYAWAKMPTASTPGEKRDEPYSITFKMGDLAEYDSYNLIYTGRIVAIGEKTVTIEERGGRLHRLDLYAFAWRNYDFNIEEIRRRNDETRQCI